MVRKRKAPDADNRSERTGTSRPSTTDDLTAYAAKRDFTRTPEPGTPPPRRGARKKAGGNAFVVQKHAARRLHYDFRLELDGVLKSWAVTRGPSLDPADRRLAVHVEDHPLEYGSFEGIIPKGQYGGGTVMLWDQGTWEPVGDRGDDYGGGHLKLRLNGEKMHGIWALVRMGGKAQRERRDNWLLIKDDDDEARRGESEAWLEDNARSVATGRNMDQIAAEKDAVWQSDRPAGEQTATVDRREDARARAIEGGRRAKFPKELEPQFATLESSAPTGDEWLHEIKFDGYRMLCRIADGGARLITRSGLDWTAKFQALAAALAKLPVETAILDGEVVAIRPDGVSDFKLLQGAIVGENDHPLSYYLFDLPYLDGLDLRKVKLEERKAALRSLVSPRADGQDGIFYSEHWIGHGGDFHQQACRHALEGIISKKRDAPYRSGRSRAWLKTKCIARQEFVVGGFSPSDAAGRALRSLALGYYDHGKLIYAGKVGTGFDAWELDDLAKRLKPLERTKSAFDVIPKAVRRGLIWVEPKLVCEVEFREWTESGALRHPSYKGLREDKRPGSITREGTQSVTAGKPDRTRAKAGNRDTDVAGVRLSHPDRVLYQEAGFTKRDLAEYYQTVADLMLPHVAGRPLSLLRCPEGTDGDCFFQRHAGPGLPKDIKSVELEEKGKKVEGLIVEDVEGLVSLVQIGVLEIHPWGARADQPGRPDRITFDLDPDPSVDFSTVVVAARELRQRLIDTGLESFLKTTGGKGLHVVVPIARRHEWHEVKNFARAVAGIMTKEAPDRFTDTMSKRARVGRIFIDYLRNDQGSTAVAPYSTRARTGAPVSFPIAWSQATSKLNSDRFTVETLSRLLAARKQDPWADISNVRQSITAETRRKFRIEE